MSDAWDKYMGPMSYRLAIIVTFIGAVIFSLSAVWLIEMANGDIDVTYGPVGKTLLLVGLLVGLSMFVIGIVDGSLRELQFLMMKKKDE